MSDVNPEQLAEKFHEAYERLAHRYGYRTREKTSVPWADVPLPNKSLMIAVCEELVDHLNTRAPSATSVGVDEVARDAERWKWFRECLAHGNDASVRLFHDAIPDDSVDEPEHMKGVIDKAIDYAMDAAIQSAAQEKTP